jgi:HNH endonuclease
MGKIPDSPPRTLGALEKAARREYLKLKSAKRAERKKKKAENARLNPPDKAKIRNLARPSSETKNSFYDSWDWRTLRMKALKINGARCQCCGADRNDIDMTGNPVRIVVDHIKPISKYWDLRLSLSNLQIMCDECNMGKGSWDETDWRGIRTQR